MCQKDKSIFRHILQQIKIIHALFNARHIVIKVCPSFNKNSKETQLLLFAPTKNVVAAVVNKQFRTYNLRDF